MKLTLIGFGFVGKAVHHTLSKHHDVKIVDPSYNDNKIEDDSDAYIICVPTPSSRDTSCDMSIVKGVVTYCPDDKPVLIKSGIKIRLCKNCSLIFLSDLITERSKKGKETIIYGDDIGGLAIIDENKDNTVLIDGIKIKNSNGIKNIFSDYSAALLLYNISNFTLNNLKIMNANVEDAINLIDSNGKLFNVHIDGSNIGSDGIDSDFSNIDAEMIHLENLNGDGIDFSKSKFKLKNFKAKNIGDKAVSVGETSSGVIYDANINSSETCIASKDNSYVLIKKLYGDLCNSFTFASYIKKRNYTHAKIKVEKEIKYKNYLLTEEAIIENGDNLLKPNSSYKEIFEFYNYGTFKKYKIQ